MLTAILTDEDYPVDDPAGKGLKKQEPEEPDYYRQILTSMRAAKPENAL